MLCVAAVCAGASSAGAADRGPAWAMHVIDDSSAGADGVKLADVNGDGLQDLAVGWEQGGISRAYLNPGPDAAADPWPAVTVGPADDVEDAVFADLDGDGAVDVISSAEGGTRGVFIHWAPPDPADYLDPGAWTTQIIPATTGLRWMYAEPMQVDGRYGLDLIAGGKDGGAMVGWLEAPANPRDTAAWQLHEMCDVGWTMSIIPKDMDSDGDEDVVVTDRYNYVGLRGARWLENPGTGSPLQMNPWTNRFIGGQGDEVMLSAMEDLDEDGWDDLIVPMRDPNGLSFFRRTDLFSNSWAEYPIQVPSDVGTCKAAGVGDVDLDGDPDVVLSFANSDGVSGVVWLSYPSSPFDPVWDDHEISGPLGTKYDVVQLLDLDADGDADVITTEESTGDGGLGVIWYENPTMTVARTPAGFFRVGWNLTSVPVSPFDAEPSAIYEDLVALGNVIENNLFRYDPGAGYAIYPSWLTEMDRGRGYWLNLSAASGDTVVSVAGEAGAEPVGVPLAQGWNLIGHPQLSEVSLESCQVINEWSTMSFETAVLWGWVDPTLYYFEPDGYRMCKMSGGDDSSLRPWRGYWLLSHRSDIELVVPLP